MKQGRPVRSVAVRAAVCFGACIAFLVGSSDCLSARQSLRNFAIEGTVGAAVVPMCEWRNFWERFGPYREQRLAGFYELGLRYHLNPKHAVVLSYERLTTEASSPAAGYYGTPEDTVGCFFGELHWEFEAMPVSVSYEFYPWGTSGAVSPYLGLGASLYFSTEVEASYTEYVNVYDNTVMPDMSSRGKRDGRGYGVHAYVGCLAPLSGSIYLVARVRGRYADGMGFTDKDEDIPVHLSGVDTALGLGYAF